MALPVVTKQMLEIAREVRVEAAAGAAGAGMNTYNYFRRLMKEKGYVISPSMAAELYRRAVPGGFEAPLQEAGKEDEKDPEEEDNPEEGEEEEEKVDDEEEDQEGQDRGPNPREDGYGEEDE